MIALHHFGAHVDKDASVFYLNPDLIVTVESRPDTIVSLINGSDLYVQETPSDVMELVREWKSSLLTSSWAAALSEQDDLETPPEGEVVADA